MEQSPMNAQELLETWSNGDNRLLAMDENNPASNKRFAKLGIPRLWRDEFESSSQIKSDAPRLPSRSEPPLRVVIKPGVAKILICNSAIGFNLPSSQLSVVPVLVFRKPS